VWELLVLAGGFALLLKAADLLVDGATGLSRRFGVPELVVGLTICAFGTSAPELFVNGAAALKGRDALVLGNVLGSNVFNTLLVLGVGGLIRPLAAKASETRKELLYGALAALGLLALAADGDISRWDGLALLGGFGLFLRHTLTLEDEDQAPPEYGGSWLREAGRLGAGLVGLPIGAHLVVTAATGIAARFGLSESLIGLTIVSAGTSLPELAATGVAAWRGRADLAVGNVLGSNLFNLLLVLGVSSVLRPLAWPAAMAADVLVFLAASGLVAAAVLRPGRPVLSRGFAAALVGGFIAYLGFLGAREQALVGGPLDASSPTFATR
jgi:cation:H+ antiporter